MKFVSMLPGGPLGPVGTTRVAARVTVIEFVFFVRLSCAVTTSVMRFAPTVRLMAGLALPDATVVPFTLSAEVGSASVAVTVRLLVVLATLAA